MKFGQLIKYDMRNNFLEKPYIKPGGEASPRTFSKKSKLKIYLDQQTENYLNILKLIRGDHLLLLHIKLLFLFFKKKVSLKLVSLPHFLRDF